MNTSASPSAIALIIAGTLALAYTLVSVEVDPSDLPFFGIGSNSSPSSARAVGVDGIEPSPRDLLPDDQPALRRHDRPALDADDPRYVPISNPRRRGGQPRPDYSNGRANPLGTKVYTSAGRLTGIVEGEMRAPHGMTLIVIAVDRSFGFGDKRIALTPDQLTPQADGTLRVGLTRRQLDALPELFGS